VLNCIYIFHGQTAAPTTYDNRLWKDILSCPAGDATDRDGRPLFVRHQEGVRSAFSRTGTTHVSAVAFTKEAMCPGGPYSTKVVGAGGAEFDVHDCPVILIACHWAYYSYIEWLRAELPHTVLLGVQDDSLQEMGCCDPALQSAILQALTRLDGYIAYTKQMLSWVRPLIPSAVYWHHPITMSAIETMRACSVEKREAICLGVSNWNYDFSNYITVLAVFRHLKKRHRTLKGDFFGIRDYREQTMSPYLRTMDDLGIVGWRGGSYYSELASYRLALQMNSRAVAGRMSAEAAAVGTPVVGNILCDMQEYCWPELSVAEFDSTRAAAYCDRLLCDPAWYAELVGRAYARLVALAAETQVYRIRFDAYSRQLAQRPRLEGGAQRS